MANTAYSRLRMCCSAAYCRHCALLFAPLFSSGAVHFPCRASSCIWSWHTVRAAQLLKPRCRPGASVDLIPTCLCQPDHARTSSDWFLRCSSSTCAVGLHASASLSRLYPALVISLITRRIHTCLHVQRRGTVSGPGKTSRRWLLQVSQVSDWMTNTLYWRIWLLLMMMKTMMMKDRIRWAEITFISTTV